jgi:type I restriction enzyme S subunit
MKSNYSRLGQYIRLVEGRNIDDKRDNLLGVSVSKVFIKSIANTVGTDFTKYKLVKKNQFTYIPDTSRRGDKIGIALLENEEEGLVSQAYTVFEISDTESLLPQYLMMWFRRPEFDRYARFISHGSVREIFNWQDMCDVELPIPSIINQKKIVKEYNVLVNRVNLNNRIIQNLEETALSIYKQWFVDFEFPDEYGNSYKSNGGEMKLNMELEKEIPVGWEVIPLKEFCLDMKSGGTPSRDKTEYWNSNNVPWLKTGEIYNNILISAEEYISDIGLKMSSAKLLPKDTVLMSMYGVNAGQIGLLKFEATTNQACCGLICENSNESAYLYYHLLYNQEFISSQAIGGAQENLSKGFIEEILILKPLEDFHSEDIFKRIISFKENLTRDSEIVKSLSNLLLSKLATLEDSP